MAFETADLQVLADAIARSFRTAPISARQLADGGELVSALVEDGARVIKSSRYADRIDVADDARILAENTDAEFWASRSFLLAPSPSFESGRYQGRCFPFTGPTTAADLLASFYAQVRSVVFDVDTIMLAQPTGRLLIATHYGSVVLLEPPPRRE
jgi:hypothetical protein